MDGWLDLHIIWYFNVFSYVGQDYQSLVHYSVGIRCFHADIALRRHHLQLLSLTLRFLIVAEQTMIFTGEILTMYVISGFMGYLPTTMYLPTTISTNYHIYQLLCSKTSKFIKLCKGDMSRRPKTAKINLGRNRRVLNSRAALTRRAILNRHTCKMTKVQHKKM